jgi:IS30 family transposase
VRADQPIPSKLSPTERRKLVALGLQAGKSNRAIAQELNVDEGTVRRDRRALRTPVKQQPAKTPEIRHRRSKQVLPARNHEVVKRDLDTQSMIEAVKLWIKEEHMVLEEIEYVLHSVSRTLYFGRQAAGSLAVRTEKPSELLAVARPRDRDKDEIIPNPEFWADWLARWLALCLPRQEEVHEKVLREVSLWARS